VTNKISNHFFGVSLSIHLHLKGTVHGHASRTDALLSNIYITEHDIKDILQTLKIGKACGDDGITHQMLRSTSETICIPLVYQFICT
jgi:hypothetical protein